MQDAVRKDRRQQIVGRTACQVLEGQHRHGFRRQCGHRHGLRAWRLLPGFEEARGEHDRQHRDAGHGCSHGDPAHQPGLPCRGRPRTWATCIAFDGHRCDQAVTAPADTGDVARLPRIVLERLSQQFDPLCHRLGAHDETGPDGGRDGLVRDDIRRSLDENLEQVE